MKKVYILILILSSFLYSTVHEDAEDGLTNGWIVSSGATISNVYDNIHGSKTIALNSSVYKYYKLNLSNTTQKNILKWDMKIDNGFYIYVNVNTSVGTKQLYYNAINHDYGVTSSGIHHGLGSSATNNSWHIFERDIEADLKDADSSYELLSINYFRIRAKGNASLDNIETIGDISPTPSATPSNSQNLIIEDAEDDLIDGWTSTSGGSVDNEYNNEKESRVIKLDSSSYKYYTMNISDTIHANKIKWDLKIADGFYIYIKVNTSVGIKQLYYNAINYDYGVTSSGIHHGLGVSATNNSWHTFERDIEADLKDANSSYELLSINSFKIRAKGETYLDNIVLVKDANNSNSRKIGAREVPSTPLSQGTIFISPSGTGIDCTEADPCSFEKLVANNITLNNGDVVFFRGGVYSFSMNGAKRFYPKGGTAQNPITYESYPGEKAIFEGSSLSLDIRDERKEGRIWLREDYTVLRNIEVRDMPEYGIRIYGSNHNIVEGCITHHNHLSGIEICGYSALSGDNASCNSNTGGKYNIIRDNISYFNSDVGLSDMDPLDNKKTNYNYGDNADGIIIHAGIENNVSNNTVYNNSDDGIDTWHSMNTRVESNLVYQNGAGAGNGSGIKLGGHSRTDVGSNAVAQYNISYNNLKQGLNVNTGTNVLLQYNTSYHNGGCGYIFTSTSTSIKNISISDNMTNIDSCAKALKQDGTSFLENDFSVGGKIGEIQSNNSWQREGVVTFMSLDVNSTLFLKPENGSFSDIGAYKE